MKHNEWYLREKIIQAMSVLATHPGKIRERLFEAYGKFAGINTNDLEAQFGDDFRCIVELLTKSDQGVTRGVPENLSAMKVEVAIDIARRIDDLFYRLMTELK